MMRKWTRQSMQQLVRERLGRRKLIVVSNRAPYIHESGGGTTVCRQPASGMAAALDPIMRASGGVWVAHGSGSADRDTVDAFDHVDVPPDNPTYTLRRVWLGSDVQAGYYEGLANEAIWPLCHAVFHRPKFSEANWNCYRRANEIFAQAVLEEAGGDPAFVFIQDYHFGLLPRMLKNENPNLAIAQFWHIPWPNRETFRAFPWREELLDGMLGNDLLGFHLPYHCQNFLETVDRSIEALVDTEHGTVTKGGHGTLVRGFPISIDFDRHQAAAQHPEVRAEEAEWVLEAGKPDCLGIGIDRMDYTKGIPERLDAVDRFLDANPSYAQRFVFLQVAVPSRESIADYRQLSAAVTAQVEAINRKWSTGAWRPVVLVRRHIDQAGLMALHRIADFCVVSSLDDGMNLVAKEFVASRTDEDGALILSHFTGAARELRDALLVNPFAPDEIALAMKAALHMPAVERKQRMRKMRAVISSHNVYRWAGKIVEALTGLDSASESEWSTMYEADAVMEAAS